MKWIGPVIVALIMTSCMIFNADIQGVNGDIDNTSGACDLFSFEVTWVSSVGSAQDARRTGTVEAGKTFGLGYVNRPPDGTHVKVTGTCTNKTQQISLKANYDNAERYTGWTVRVENRNSPTLVFL